MMTATMLFVDFYRSHWAATVRLAHVLTGDQSIAEDVAQEGFLRLHPNFDRIENPGGYLRSIIVNLSNEYHRRRARDRRRTTRISQEGDRARLVARPEDVADDELLSAVDQLPYRQKAVLVLRYYEGLSEQEIAKAMGVRSGTVKSLASRGLKRLSKEVER
jgi:RNA polymerase sigma-70 factor (sigma-E family)